MRAEARFVLCNPRADDFEVNKTGGWRVDLHVSRGSNIQHWRTFLIENVLRGQANPEQRIEATTILLGLFACWLQTFWGICPKRKADALHNN